MGDMLSLIEKAQEDYDEKKAAELEKKIRKNKFTLEDFLEQMGQIKKMGGIAKILDMMPGINSNAKNNINMAKSEQEFMERLNGLMAALQQAEGVWGFCYTQLTDVEQEVNGLYTYDRHPKFPPEVIRAINTQKAAVEE